MCKNVPIKDRFTDKNDMISYIRKIKNKKNKKVFKNTDDMTFDVTDDGYKIEKAYVVSNERKIYKNNKIIYIPVYFVMFL